MTGLAEQLRAPGAGRVLVAGSINMDLVVTAPRHPQVGETVIGGTISRHPGGKGSNQAVAAAATGAPVEFIGAVGDDEAGVRLRAFLEDRGIAARLLRSIPGVDSGLAVVVVAEGDNTVVVVSGANAQVGPEDLAGIEFKPGDVLVSQFEISEETVHSFFERGKAAGARTVLNPSPFRTCSDELWALSDVIVINEIELRSLGESRGSSRPRDRMLADIGGLIEREGQEIVVTLGDEGCLVVSDHELRAIPGRRVSVVDTTGAGDCFLGFLAGRLMHGDDLVTAANLANVAASLCIQRIGAGTSMPTADEVARAVAASVSD